MLCSAGKTEVFITIIFIYHPSFPKRVIVPTYSKLSFTQPLSSQAEALG